MRITEVNDFDICLGLEKLSKQYNITLTFEQKNLYIFFIRFCEEKGQYDETTGQYYCNLSVKEIAREFAAGHSAVIKALKALSGCTAINRVKSSSVGGKNNKTVMTYLNVDCLTDDSD